MAVSQKDIARALGVTQATVSMAFRNRSNISDELRRAILSLSDKMGYSPNHSAVSLATKATKVISVVVPPAMTNASEGFLRFIGFLQREARRRGYMFQLDQKLMESRSADGVIITDIMPDGYETSMARAQHIPLIYGGGPSRPLRDNSVAMDNFGGAAKAVAYLHELGHKKIAFFGLVVLAPLCRERYDGYLQAAGERGLPTDGLCFRHQHWFCEPSEVEAYEVEVVDLLRRGATALLASHDMAAIGAMRVLSRLGISVPEDVSVVGFDDSTIARAWLPPLTVVRLDIEGAAAATVDQLLTIVAGAGAIAGRLIGTELVIRRTTGPPGAALALGNLRNTSSR